MFWLDAVTNVASVHHDVVRVSNAQFNMANNRLLLADKCHLKPVCGHIADGSVADTSPLRPAPGRYLLTYRGQTAAWLSIQMMPCHAHALARCLLSHITYLGLASHHLRYTNPTCD